MNDEWFTDDDGGHKSFVESVMGDAAAASAPVACVLGARSGGQSPARVPLIVDRPTPSGFSSHFLHLAL